MKRPSILTLTANVREALWHMQQTQQAAFDPINPAGVLPPLSEKWPFRYRGYRTIDVRWARPAPGAPFAETARSHFRNFYGLRIGSLRVVFSTRVWKR